MIRQLCVSVLVVAAGGAVGCGGLPGYGGRSICPGLEPGDVLDFQLGAPPEPDESWLTECDSRLGFSVGAEFSTTIVEAGQDGCGFALGPVNVPGSSFVFAFDLARSQGIVDERAYSWTSASNVMEGGCEGGLTMYLANVSPELIEGENQGRLLVGYVPRLGEGCIDSCNYAFPVTVTKRK